MAITNGHQTVGTTPTQVDGSSISQSTLIIHNNDTTKNLYIGGSNVSSTNGIPVAKLQYIEIPVPPRDAVYLVASADAVSVSWMKIEQD